MDPDAGIKKCMDIMCKHRVRHLPVVEKRKVVGVITSTDLLILTVNEKDNIIEQLERYISPSGYYRLANRLVYCFRLDLGLGGSAVSGLAG